VPEIPPGLTSDDGIDGPDGDLPVADLDMDSVDEDHRVNASRSRFCHSAMPSIR
jgi:hypothetical protein